MSDNIDIPIQASGDDGVNRLTSAIDRLEASMTRLGKNTAVGQLAEQMKIMQATMVTGFAGMAASTEKVLQAVGARQVSAIAANGEKAVKATEAAGLKLKEADARTWEQIQRGSAANVTRAFHQLAQGVPVEAVQARLGAVAASAAASFNGQLDKLAQFQANTKSLWATHYSALAGASEAQMGLAQKMNAQWDAAMRARSASKIDVRTLLGLPSESEARSAGAQIAAQMRESVANEMQRAKAASKVDARTLLGLPSESEARSTGAQIAAQMRESVANEMQRAKAASKVDARTLLGLPSEAEARSAGAQIAAQMRESVANEMRRARAASKVDARTLLGLPSESEARSAGAQIAAQMREAVANEIQRARAASKIDARTLLGLPSESEARAAGSRIAAQMREAVANETQRAKAASPVDARTLLGMPPEAEMRSFSASLRAQMQDHQKLQQEIERTAERQRVLNSAFQNMSPGQQLTRATRAQTYGGMGGDAASRFGSAAAGADVGALRRAHEQLPGAVRNSQNALQGHNDIMREGHSLARGLAGSLGGLWLTYGSVAPLLAGAAIAASLKHVVTVGKEVEQQLNFVFALSGAERQGVNLEGFLSITEGSLRSVTEAANAMRALAQSGLSASQALQVLPGILDLATVGEMTVAQAAIAATGAVSAFGLSYSEAGRVADIFAKTAAESNTSVLAITESMKQASTVASLFKVSIEETAGMLGLLAKINVTGGAAGTSMTNMLTGLYEPTEKAKRALKEIGVQTATASGALKPFTQLIEEMKTALSGYNDSAKTDLLGSIFTVRGVKSALLAIDNVEDFKTKVKEAQTAVGFMRGVVAQLEDSTVGAFDRLKVSVENAFSKAFRDAGPFVQQLGLHLSDAFKEGGGAQVGLANFATNIARLSGYLLENAGVVAASVAGYLGYRALGPVIALIQAAMTATAAATTAQVAATATSIAHTTAHAAGAGTLVLLTAATEAQAAATATAATASAAWGATLLPILAAVAVAVAGAAALWLLFRDNTNDADVANTKISNSLHVVSDALDREIKRLEESNKLWDERAGKFRDPAQATPEQVNQARTQVKKLEAEIRATGGDPAKALAHRPTIDPISGVLQNAEGYHRLGEALEFAKKNLEGFESKLKTTNEVMLPGQALENVRKARQQIQTELEKFAKQAEEKNTQGEFYQKDAGIRALYEKGKSLIAELPSIDPKNLDAAKAKIDAVGTSLKQLKDQVNSRQSSRAVKPDIKGENAALNASLKRLDVELQLQQLQSQSDIASARQQNKRGEIGDLQLINKELEAKLALDQAAINVAKRQYELADAKDKVGKMATYQGRMDVGAKQAEVDTKEAAEKRASVLTRMAEEEKKFEAKSLADRGQHVDAFLMEYGASYGLTIAKVNADILASQSLTQRFALEDYRAHLAEMQKAGTDNALAKQLQGEFGAVIDNLDLKLQSLVDSSGPGAGLGAMFRNAARAAKEYEGALPKLIAKQKEMQALADRTQDPKDQRAATSMLARIKSDASQARNIWVDVSKTIGQSLADAFGTGGKALGDLLTATLQYGARQRQIQEEFEKSDKGTEAKKQAAQDTASSQISAYGDMAGAAAGFFDTQSKGYQTLMTVSKVFHAAELAMTLAELVPKGISAILSQGSGDPYSAFGRMAAMAAIVAGLGVAVGGLGSKKKDTSAADRRAAAGTGTVFGDFADKDGKYSAKSESIARAMSLVAENSSIELNYTQGMLRALLSIESSLGSLGNLVIRQGSGTSGQFSGIQTGTNVLGGAVGMAAGAIAGGVGGAAAGAYYGMAAGSVGGPIGAAVGAVLGAVVGYIASVLTNTKTTVVDEGMTFGNQSLGKVMDQGIEGSAYADVNTRKKFIGFKYSDKTKRQYGELPDELEQQFSTVLENMALGVKSAAEVLGVGGTAFVERLRAFEIKLKDITVKDQTGEEVQKELQAIFSSVGDDMARWSVAGLQGFQRAGEGYFETLIRVASNYANLDSILKSVSMTFGATSIASLAARENLISMAGGIDELASKVGGFSENFLTKAERLAPVQAYVTEQLQAMGLASIDTRDEFKRHVLGLNLTVAAEQEQYVALMNLQGAFAKVHAASEDLTKSQQEIADEHRSLQDELDDLTMTRAALLNKERGALDALNRAMFDQVQAAKAVVTAREDLNSAYEDEKQHLQENVDRVKSLGESWKAFRNNLLLGDKSTLTPQAKYEQARSQFETTLAAARGGDTDAQSRFEEVANSFIEASRTANASSDAYAADFTRVLSASADGVVWASQQVDIGKSSLDRLDASVAHLIDIKAGVMTTAQAMEKLVAADAALRAMQLKPEKDYAPGYQAAGPQYSTQGTTMGGQAAADAARTGGGMTKEQADAMLRELTAAREAAARQAQEANEHMYNAADLAAEKTAKAAREAARESAWNDNLRAQTA